MIRLVNSMAMGTLLYFMCCGMSFLVEKIPIKYIVILEMDYKHRGQISIQSNIYSNKDKELCWEKSNITNLAPDS